MKTNDNFQMAGQISNLLNAQISTDNFDRDLQAEAAFNYLQLLFDNGYPALAMCFQILEFKAKHPNSRHKATADKMLKAIYSKR